MKKKILYCLYCGDLYGTELMALAHAKTATPQMETVIFAPRGKIHGEALKQNIPSVVFTGMFSLFFALIKAALPSRQLVILTTSIPQSFVGILVNLLFFYKSFAHKHVVHGGVEDRASYGKKHVLNPLPIRFIAVSHFVAMKLLQYNIPGHRIDVVENFLDDVKIVDALAREPQTASTKLQVIIVSRLAPIKRIQMLLDAFDLEPRLNEILHVAIAGTGSEYDTLSERIATGHYDIALLGYRSDVPGLLLHADICLHLCDVEPFGLVIIEAMAIGLPVLVPDSGGAGEIVSDTAYGYRFDARSVRDLADKLLDIAAKSRDEREKTGERGHQHVREHYRASSRRDLLLAVLNC